MPAPEPPDFGRDSLSVPIYQQLRFELMTGQHQPGAKLSIRKLAGLLNTSATPVREAVFQLIREGAIELKTGFQPRVPVLELKEYTRIRDTRVPLERVAGELAAVHITEGELAELVALHGQYAEAGRNGHWHAALIANQAFHFTIYRASKNPVLVRLIENLWLLAGPFVAQRFPLAFRDPSDIHPHRMIMDALRRRSPAEVGDHLVRDLREASERIMRNYTPAPTQTGQRRRKSAG